MANSRLYVVNEAKLAELKLGPQASLIVKELLDRQPASSKTIADAIKDRLQTRQDPLRVVSFYFSVWKRSGLVSLATAKDANEPDTQKSEEPVSQPQPSAPPDPVPPQTQNETPVEQPVASVTTEDPASTFPAHLDVHKSSLRDVITQALESGSGNYDVIQERIAAWGRSLSKQQIKDTVRKLVARGELVKDENGIIRIK